MKTKKLLSIAMLVLALASCSSKDDKKTTEVKEELLSQKDTTSPLLDDSDCNFVYGEV